MFCFWVAPSKLFLPLCPCLPLPPPVPLLGHSRREKKKHTHLVSREVVLRRRASAIYASAALGEDGNPSRDFFFAPLFFFLVFMKKTVTTAVDIKVNELRLYSSFFCFNARKYSLGKKKKVFFFYSIGRSSSRMYHQYWTIGMMNDPARRTARTETYLSRPSSVSSFFLKVLIPKSV